MTALEVRLGTQDVEVRGEGAPLVWLPSSFGEAAWLPVHETLAASFRVVVPAAPKMTGVLSKIDGVDDYVLHLLDTLDALAIDEAAVVGTSFGGWLAAELAAIRPDVVSALVVVDAMGLRVEGAPPAEIFATTPGKLARLLFADRDAIDPSAMPVFDRHADPMAAYQALIEGQEAMARLGWSPYLHDPKLPARLPRYRGPSLVVWGRHDGVLPPEHGAMWAELLGAEVEWIEGAGHLPAVEQPDVVAAIVATWLERMDARR